MSDLSEAEKAIFRVAVSMDDDEQRAQFLENACRGNQAARREIDSLLNADLNLQGHSFMSVKNKPADEINESTVDPHVGSQSEVIGNYKLLQKIGEGGFGIVYMADQIVPIHRRVALKIIKSGMDTKQVIARFEGERQALALMDHPNIAKVLDAGATETGRPYFVMELVRGVPVTEYCDDRNLSTQDRLRIFTEICSAVQHAHQKGIIHRDIKPSNILVTTNGDLPVSKVIDFGIAKATQGRLTNKTLFTQFQQFIGTPSYMSPEQAQMSAVDVDTRSDIYSLGVLLYELLTGKTPLNSDELLNAGFDEVCRRIREEEAPVPSKRISSLQQEELKTLAKNRGVDPAVFPVIFRGDLDWIIMKAVEKDRARRYSTADALAEDIQRHLNREPVSAVPPSATYRLKKFVHRNRSIVLTTTAVMASLILGTFVATTGMLRAIDARNDAESARIELADEVHAKAIALDAADRARRDSTAANQRLRHVVYAHELQAVVKHLEQGTQPSLSFHASLLDRCDPAIREWEWHWLRDLSTREIEVFGARHRQLIDQIEYTPDGSTIISADRSGRIYSHDATTQTLVGKPINRWGSTFAISPDGRHIATLFERAERIGIAINQLGGRRLFQLAGHPKSRHDAFGEKALVGYIQTMKRLTIVSMEFSPNGKQLAVGTNDGELSLWDVEGQTLLNAIQAHHDIIMKVVFSPDGKLLATASAEQDAGAKLWDANTLKHLATLGHVDGAAGVAFRPDSRLLAVAGLSGQLTVWDRAGKLVTHLPGAPLRWALGVEFSSDGNRLFAASSHGEFVEWEVPSWKAIRRRDLADWTFDLAVHPSSTTVLANNSHFLFRWHTSGRPEDEFETHDAVSSVSINQAESRIVCAHRDGKVTLWDAVRRKELLRAQPHDVGRMNPVVVRFSRLENRLISSGVDGKILLLDHQTLEPIRVLHAGQHFIRRFAVSHDGRRIAFMRHESSMQREEQRSAVNVVDTESGQIQELKSRITGSFNDFDFSPDGMLLATCINSGEERRMDVIVWNISIGDVVYHWTKTEDIHVQGIRFLPDGDQLVIASPQRGVYSCNLTTNEMKEPLEFDGSWSEECSLLPDGRRLLMAGRHGVDIFDIELQLHLCRIPMPDVRPTLAVGQTVLVVAGANKIVRVIPLHWPTQ